MSALIMAIDSYRPILDLYEILLTDEGYHTILSEQTFEDVAYVERANPDLIILDFLVTGQRQGLRMFEALKHHQATANIPIIVCTAAPPAVLEAFEDYFGDPRVRLILKPFEIEQLTTSVSHLLALG